MAGYSAGVNMEPDIENFCADNGIVILACNDTPRRFIIGSFGFGIVTTHGTKGFGRVFVFPIAPDIAIRLAGTKDRCDVFQVPSVSVRQTNISISEMSHTIAGQSKNLVLDYKDYVKLTILTES